MQWSEYPEVLQQVEVRSRAKLSTPIKWSVLCGCCYRVVDFAMGLKQLIS